VHYTAASSAYAEAYRHPTPMVPLIMPEKRAQRNETLHDIFAESILEQQQVARTEREAWFAFASAQRAIDRAQRRECGLMSYRGH
jgi:hypothetical protein